MTRPRLSPRDRLFAWIVTGPVGRLIAFFGDLAAYWYRWTSARLTRHRRDDSGAR